MRKQTGFLYGVIFTIFALFGLNINHSKPQNTAKAATEAPYTITFVANGGYCVTPSLETDENGYIPVETPIPEAFHSSFVFKGWYIKQTDPEPISHDTQFTKDTEVTAMWASKTYNYTITKNQDSSVSVVGQTSPSGYDYELTDGTVTSINDALSLIKTEGYGKEININFNNIELTASEPTIDLSIPKVTISGKITSEQVAPIFRIVPSADNSRFTFKDLRLINNNYATSILTTTPEYNYTSNIHILDCNFSSSAVNHHALTIVSTNYRLKLSGNTSQHCTFLFNHLIGMSLDLSEELTNSEANALTASINPEIYDELITDQILSSNVNKILFKANPRPIQISQQYKNSSLYANSVLNMNFDLDGGTFTRNLNTIYYYKFPTTTPLPSSMYIEKAHSVFRGWFGKLTLSESQQNTYDLSTRTWYFDIPSLETFADLNYDLAKINECFKSNKNDLKEFLTGNSFTEYMYDSEKLDIRYLPVDMAFALNVEPSFIASWDYNEYTISFDSNGGSSVDPITVEYYSTLPPFETPTKTGFDFGGWFSDSDLTTPFTETTMTTENITIYAKWDEISYTVTFKTNNGTQDIQTTYHYGDVIELPTGLTKKGYHIEDWYTNEELTEKFTNSTVTGNLTIYVKWAKSKFKIYFDTNNVGSAMPSISVEYDANIPTLESPTAPGFTFDGWFSDKSYKTLFSQNKKMPAYDLMAYAKWTVREYTITCITFTNPAQIKITEKYNTTLDNVYQPIKKGYSFQGWFTDETYKNRYNFSTMPAENLTIYAKWSEKLTVSVDSAPQKTIVDSKTPYSVDSNLSGFSIEYFVDGSWQATAPTKVGSYDIKLYRAEDDYYAEFESIIENAYVIEAKELELTWLVVLLYALFIIEIVGVIAIKMIKKQKRKTPKILAVALPFGVIPTTDFVLVIIGAVLVLFGFIYVIYELVNLHKIVPEIDNTTSKYDTRSVMENRTDTSENKEIESNVDSLLKNQGFVTTDEFSKDDEYVVEEDIIELAEKQYNPKIKSESDENEE